MTSRIADFMPSIIIAALLLGAAACAPADDESTDEGKPTPGHDERAPGHGTDSSEESAAASTEEDPSLEQSSSEKGRKSYDCCAKKRNNITVGCEQYYGLPIFTHDRCDAAGGTIRGSGCGAYGSCDGLWDGSTVVVGGNVRLAVEN
jgi:hypothetical protein